MRIFVVALCGLLIGAPLSIWLGRRTDALRRVAPQAAQRIDEARIFGGR